MSKDEYNENWSQNAADHSKHDELERCPRSRTDVRPTDRVATDATDCSMLNFNRRRATVMIHTRAVNQGQLVQKIEWKQTDVLLFGESLSRRKHYLYHLWLADCEQSWCYPQNRQYSNYPEAAISGPSQGHRQQVQSIVWSLNLWFLRYARRDRQTDTLVILLRSVRRRYN